MPSRDFFCFGIKGGTRYSVVAWAYVALRCGRQHRTMRPLPVRGKADQPATSGTAGESQGGRCPGKPSPPRHCSHSWHLATNTRLTPRPFVPCAPRAFLEARFSPWGVCRSYCQCASHRCTRLGHIWNPAHALSDSRPAVHWFSASTVVAFTPLYPPFGVFRESSSQGARSIRRGLGGVSA